MYPATTPLGRMLLEDITPVVMVLTTPLVEESCSKNGLSFVEMIRPFCSFNNIDVPVRTSSEQAYRLQRFKLRVFYASDIHPPDFQVAKERLKKIISQAGEDYGSDLCSDVPEVNDLLSKSPAEILPSWFKHVNEELIRTMSFGEHEAFDHPVACLLVVSSNDEQPINRLVDLFNSNQLPSLLNDGAMDPKILKIYLLLHDNQDDTSEKASKILADMRSTFGPNASQLLSINSSTNGLVEHLENPWVPFKSGTCPAERLGCCLNADDSNAIKDLIQDLASKNIIPYMEEKVRVLNQQVSATRKGFRNQIKNLWWRKGKEDLPDASSGPVYTFSSVESQIRVLGDYAFMLRDYELALSNYRLISTDYKLDKAWKRYAAVQEMMGLTYFMLDQSRKEAEYCMEQAFNTYLKSVSGGNWSATRCGLWWVEMLKTRDQFKEAAGVYFRITGEEPLHSAVMLEQGSYCYLFSEPPMLRKYGFHLILSGNQYKKSDQTKHAIRTYKRAIAVFKGTAWSYIKDHVHFHVGQWYALIGLHDAAVFHMMEILSCAHQSKITQESFLKNFLQIFKKTGKSSEVLQLPLPVINGSSLEVVFEDHRTYASPDAAGVRESLWRSLEEEVIPSQPTARTNWLDLHSKFMTKRHIESNICVVGEPIRVVVEFQNPLQVSIPLSSVSLICETSPGSDEADPDSSASIAQYDSGEIIESSLERLMQPDSSFMLSDLDFLLEGDARRKVQLIVTPMVEGVLKIMGVKWKLYDSVVGFHNFITSTTIKNAKRKRRLKRSPVDNLKFVVVKNLPRLEGIIGPLPGKVYAGHLGHLTLNLNNKSTSAVKNLKMNVSHPRYLSYGNANSLDVGYPACLEKKINGQEAEVVACTDDKLQSMYLFPEDITISRDTPFSWPLWFHASVPGRLSLHIVLYYEIEDPESFMKFRTLRMCYNFEVLPSVEAILQISSSPLSLQEFIVRLNLTNKTTLKAFHIHQLSSIGNQWEISLIQPVQDFFASPSILPGQVISYSFTIRRRKESEKLENSCITRRDVRLSTVESPVPMYDTSLSPLSDFHRIERLNQEKPPQGYCDTVDFILISRPADKEGEPGVSNSTPLLSHHICHCSITNARPISWVMEGPRQILHDFSDSFCEISLDITIHNSSDFPATVTINTLDFTRSSAQSSDAATASTDNQAGWHDASTETNIKITTGSTITLPKSSPMDSVPAFLWSGSSSTMVRLPPNSSEKVPLQVCFFSPGAYDLSNYTLQWKLHSPDSQPHGEEADPVPSSSSGYFMGYPYHITVLQSV
ncbi:hypothetical protein MLD38_035584 [Melastoma candidum]|uniref:Uncharacterized protein n=1 Tax=Melastoma candidum TaxID=119954 RepID=A0ACB9LI87_9MYRT|nr:hypothetical protein MLD38_035584 [Melastoma candidum]